MNNSEPNPAGSPEGPAQGSSTSGQPPNSTVIENRNDTTAHHDPHQTFVEPASGLNAIAHKAEFTVPGYEVRSELGRGGMGVVYWARQVRANRDVALKMILNADHAGSEEVARFRAEAEAVARLQHPAIVTVYEVGEHSGRPFFSMELCPQGSLAISSSRPLTPQAISELILKVTRGVAAAHAAGVVHRDLKPGNILLTAENEPKIADFGLSKQLGPRERRGDGDLTASGEVLGTPSYMAPEQAGAARHVGPPADVYALGAILYDLLTGRPPFRGATPTDTLLQLLTEDPRPPRELSPNIPRDLETICLRCLEKEPARRYPTAGELAEDLARFLDGEPVSSARSGFVDRLAGAIDRVQLHERWAKDGTLLLALAPVMFLPEVWVTAAVQYNWPPYLLAPGQYFRLFSFLLVVGYFRGWRWMPQGTAERQLWAVWTGYVAACFAFGLSSQIAMGFSNFASSRELKLYQGLACLTGLAFFVLAPNFWGYCAVIGLGFFALSFLMSLNLQLAPIEFGTCWAVVLILMGLRLRRLGGLTSKQANAES